jgi:hypothetical protein
MDHTKYLTDNVRAFALSLWPEGSVAGATLDFLVAGSFEALQKNRPPLQLCTDDEIAKFAKVMYDMAARPLGTHHRERYAVLIASLKKHPVWHGFGETLGRAIVATCQRQFALRLTKVETLRTDEEVKAMKLATPLRASVMFLGQLFLHGIATEAVVVAVLSALLHSEENQTEQKLFEYELAMFCDLFGIVIQQLTPTALTEFIPEGLRGVEDNILELSINQGFLERVIQLRNNESVGKRRFKMMPVCR